MCSSNAACESSFGAGSECASGPLFIESGSGINKSYACTIPVESTEAWLLRRGSISLDCEGLQSDDGRCTVGLTVNVTGDAVTCQATGCQGVEGASRLYCTGATCECASGTCGNAVVTSLLAGVTGPVQLECTDASSALEEDGHDYSMDCSLVLTGLPITNVDLACSAGTCVMGDQSVADAANATGSATRSVPQVEPPAISVAAPILAALPVATLAAAGLFVATYALAAGDVLRAKAPRRDQDGANADGDEDKVGSQLDGPAAKSRAHPLQVPRAPTWSWRLRRSSGRAEEDAATRGAVVSIPIEAIAGDAPPPTPPAAPAGDDEAPARVASSGLAWGIEAVAAATGAIERRFTRQKILVPVEPVEGFEGASADASRAGRGEPAPCAARSDAVALPVVVLDRADPLGAAGFANTSDSTADGDGAKLALVSREAGPPQAAPGPNHHRVSVLAFENLCVSVRLSRSKAASRRLAVAAKALGHAATHPAETLAHRSGRDSEAVATLDVSSAGPLGGADGCASSADELRAAAEFVASLHAGEEFDREPESTAAGVRQGTGALEAASGPGAELVARSPSYSLPPYPANPSISASKHSHIPLPVHRPVTRRTASRRMAWSALEQQPDLESAGGEGLPHGRTPRLRSLLDVLAPKRQSWTVLAHASGELHAGELTGILGPSGGGKTTLLGALAGSAADLGGGATVKGQVRLDGRSRRVGEVAFVPQADAFIPTLTTRECVHYSAALRMPRGTPARGVRAAVTSTLAELGLQAVADSPVGGPGGPRGLSGGERRRVSIAMELVTDPSILLLDEPTSGLDSHASSRVVETLRRLARAGRIVAASLHSPGKDDFERLDNVVLVSHGRMLYHGSPLDAQRVVEDAQRPLVDLDERAVKVDLDVDVDVEFGTDACRSIANPSTLGGGQKAAAASRAPIIAPPASPSSTDPTVLSSPLGGAAVEPSPYDESQRNLAERLLEVASDPVAIRRILVHGTERRLREAVSSEPSRPCSPTRRPDGAKLGPGGGDFVCRASCASVGSVATEASELTPRGSNKRFRLGGGDAGADPSHPSASSGTPLEGSRSGGVANGGGLTSTALARLDALEERLDERQPEERAPRALLSVSSPTPPLPPAPKRASFSMQLAFMCWRTLADVWRSPALLRTHSAVALVAGVLLGAIYWQLDNTNVGVQNRLGATFFVLAFLGFTSLSTTDLLLNERRTVSREVRAGYYGPAPYLVSKLVADGLLLRTLPALLVWAPMYHMAGMRSDASASAVYALGICGFSATVGATSVAVTALADTAGLAALAMNMLLLFGLAFAGFLVQVASMPGVLRWIHYLSFFYYAMEATVSSQIDGQAFSLDAAGYSTVSNVKGATYLKTLGFDSENTVRDLGILAGFYYAAVSIALLAFIAKLPRRPRQG